MLGAKRVIDLKYRLIEERVPRENVAGVAELGDARDLKSCGPLAYAGSTPAPGTIVFLVG